MSDQVHVLVNFGDLLATNCYEDCNILLYHYQEEFWELVHYPEELTSMVRKACLDFYLDSISLKQLFN